MSTAMFSVNENLVCLNKHLQPYAAKVSAIKNENYIIHYHGWNARYDEKVKIGEERGKLFKGTVEEYCKKKKIPVPVILERGGKKKPTAVQVVVQEDDQGAGPAPPPVQDQSAQGLNLRDVLAALFNPSTPIKLLEPIKLSDALHGIIRKDKIIVQEDLPRKIPKTPAIHTVEGIVQEYHKFLDDSTTVSAYEASRLKKYSEGVIDYFNHSLARHLLYDSEKATYKKIVYDILKAKKIKVKNFDMVNVKHFKPSEFYGFIHLLRLMLKIHDLLNENMTMRPRDVENIQEGMERFAEFLDQKKVDYYKEDQDYELV